MTSVKLTAEIEARQAYIALFDNLGDAVAFESQVLSIGSYLLPRCAQRVLLDEPPTASYWQWLAGQRARSEHGVLLGESPAASYWNVPGGIRKVSK